MRCERLARMALGLALASPALANTYVIDDNGGPGVDFTDIPRAIAAASAGDVLLVRAGSYHPFTLSKGLSILGESGVVITGSAGVVVNNLPVGQTAVLTDFTTQPYYAATNIGPCHDGTVIVQRVTSKFSVTDSTDVRLWNVVGTGADASFGLSSLPWTGAGLVAWRSRVEIVQSTMLGAVGSANDDNAYPGGPGVFAAGHAPGYPNELVHIARTSCVGGTGGSFFYLAGDGGDGVLVGANGAFGTFGCEVVIAGGNASTIQGGAGGSPSPSPCDGVSGGSALCARDPEARYSGATLIPGMGCSGPAASIEADEASFVVAPGFVDPTLAVNGSSAPGGTLVFQIRGHPRSTAFLNYGKTPVVRASGESQIDVLVDVIRGLKLGAMPVSGQIDRSFPIPSNAAVGSLLIFQATVVLPTGELRRTNSVPVIVR